MVVVSDVDGQDGAVLEEPKRTAPTGGAAGPAARAAATASEPKAAARLSPFDPFAPPTAAAALLTVSLCPRPCALAHLHSPSYTPEDHRANMARGVASPAPNPLPKVSFVKVTDEFTQKQKGVHDGTARAYGCV